MRLLVTRPTANAVPLAEILARMGHDVLVSPVIDLVANPMTLPHPQDMDALAFTSANGVHALEANLAAQAPDTPASADGHAHVLKDWQAIPAYAVGPQTAAILRRAGWQKIIKAEGDVASLAARLIADRKKGARICHLAGRHRAGNLGATLDAAGLIYHPLVLYIAEPVEAFSPAAQAALQADGQAANEKAEAVDGVLIYSQRSAQQFLRLCDGLRLAQKPMIYCLSDTIARLMQAAGYKTKCAPRPDEEAMLSLFSPLSGDD